MKIGDNWISPGTTMTADSRDSISLSYRELLLRQYKISPELVADERAGVSEARAGGVAVVFLKPPFHSLIRTADPALDAEFDGQITGLASDLDVSTIDLSDVMPDQDRYWVDPLHLNLAGAAYFAPALAAALSTKLSELGV